MNMKYPALIPTAEPFFFPGDRTGCLLVHGFTGTPKEMRWLGEYLSSQGYTVLGVRLAGHATQPKDMLRVHWTDWVASVEDGWNMLSDCTDRVVIMGLSMGGILSLLFAAHFPVAGVVAMSTPHHLPDDPRLPYIKLLSRIQPSVPKGPPDWRDPEVVQRHVDYPDYPTRSLAELRDLVAEMRVSLPKVTAPTLLIYSKGDRTVRAEERHTEQICDSLGSTDKQTLWVENSGHVVTEDAAREQVFQAVAGFVARIVPGTE
jgi:carboxylesterase